MDARRDQFYTALFKDGERISEDRALSAQEIYEELKDIPEVTVCGDGTEKFISLCEGANNLFEASLASRDQNALSVAILGFEKYIKDETVTAKELKPIYLRMPQAEREKLEREKARKEEENK
jgi:tRNA threonylcarbamoyladenosine biosynthesis protein TsaB